MVKYEIWVLTAGIYKRILVDTVEQAMLIQRSLEVKDEWID